MTLAPWRSRIVGQGAEDPTQLLANPQNWRTHPAAQREALRGALDQVGWVQQVLVNRVTGHVVDGHARVEEAITRGEAEVPVLYVELDPAEEALVLASLDPIGAMADQDDDRLRQLLAEVTFDNEGLAASIAGLLPDDMKVGLTDPDDVPEIGDSSNVQLGDLFALGDHRLMCGDATNTEHVAQLLGGERPSLMVTDPPYGVEYDPKWRADVKPGANYALGKVSNDDRADWREAWMLSPASVAYVWHGGLHAHVVAESLISAGYELRAQIIWRKQAIVLSRGHYHWQHEPAWVAEKDGADQEGEPAWYAVRRGSTAGWGGSRRQSTVWDIASVHRTAGTSDDVITDHGTQKPVECMARPIRNHKGDVYEPFSGSGTTVIAAEQLGRRAYAMEIDPRYVAVAIERWEKFTGRTAERVNG